MMISFHLGNLFICTLHIYFSIQHEMLHRINVLNVLYVLTVLNGAQYIFLKLFC